MNESNPCRAANLAASSENIVCMDRTANPVRAVIQLWNARREDKAKALRFTNALLPRPRRRCTTSTRWQEKRRPTYSLLVAAPGAFSPPLVEKQLQGARYAVDNIRYTAGLVATGTGKFLHAGRFYSHFAGARAGSPGHQPAKWSTKRCLTMAECVA
jgi:hypothetical protein